MKNKHLGVYKCEINIITNVNIIYVNFVNKNARANFTIIKNQKFVSFTIC